MDYAQKAQRYIEILHRVRVLARPQISPDMTDEQLLAYIQRNAAESFGLMKESNAILSELVFSRDAATLTDEDIKGLSSFADELFNYTASDDCGIAYKIHCLLLKAARARGDDDMIVRELYYCGLTMVYLNVSDNRQRHNAFGSQIRAYFKEGADYMARYEEFGETTRDYIVRSIGNCKAGLPRCARHNVEEYFRITDQTMGIIDSDYYRQLNPNLPWENYKYAIALDEMTLLSYLRENKMNGTEDAVTAQRVYRAAEYAYKKSGKFDPNDNRLQSWRIVYYYNGARYLAGEGTAADVVECILELVESADADDYSTEGVRKNILMLAQALSYQPLLEPEDAKRLAPRIEDITNRAMQYLENMPASNEPRVMNAAIRELADAETEIGADAYRVRKVFRYLPAGHKPTYIHSLMVALLTRELTARLIKTNPEAMLGVRGYTTVEQVRAHAEEICALAYNCGLYHDLGKSMMLMYIGINARRLLDEEFECIQWHPYLGYQLLTNMGRTDLGEAALYHHRFYNNAGGYPAGCKGCSKEMKPIVDVLSVADSLDAATDGIGRCYTMAKPFEALVGEFRAQSCTRYSPYVAALFDDAEFYEKLKKELYAEREKVYIHVYRSTDRRRPLQQQEHGWQAQAKHEQ